MCSIATGGVLCRAPTRKVAPISFASFTDPDGNGWLLQEITDCLPGR